MGGLDGGLRMIYDDSYANWARICTAPRRERHSCPICVTVVKIWPSGAGPTLARRSSRGAPVRPTADRGPERTSGALVGSVGHSLTRRIRFSTPEAPESHPDPRSGTRNFHMGRNWAYEQRIGSILCGKSTEKICESSRGHQSGQEEAWTPQFGGSGFCIKIRIP